MAEGKVKEALAIRISTLGAKKEKALVSILLKLDWEKTNLFKWPNFNLVKILVSIVVKEQNSKVISSACINLKVASN